jgi:hypothetical protein
MAGMNDANIVWTDYFRYRVGLRGYNLAVVERFVLSSKERYYDTVTLRNVAVGKHGNQMVMIPYEQTEITVAPITIHATSRAQINARIKTRRFGCK